MREFNNIIVLEIFINFTIQLFHALGACFNPHKALFNFRTFP